MRGFNLWTLSNARDFRNFKLLSLGTLFAHLNGDLLRHSIFEVGARILNFWPETDLWRRDSHAQRLRGSFRASKNSERCTGFSFMTVCCRSCSAAAFSGALPFRRRRHGPGAGGVVKPRPKTANRGCGQEEQRRVPGPRGGGGPTDRGVPREKSWRLS